MEKMQTFSLSGCFPQIVRYWFSCNIQYIIIESDEGISMWKLFAVILCIIAAYIAARYIYIILKRQLLIGKLKKLCRKNRHSMRLNRGRFASIFVTDFKPDLTIETSECIYEINLLTTRFRYVCYQFVDKTNMKIIKARRGVYLANIRRPSPSATVDRISVIRNVRLPYDESYPELARKSEKTVKNVLIIFPAPAELTAIKENGIVCPGNGDFLYNSFYVYFLDGFLQSLDTNNIADNLI